MESEKAIIASLRPGTLIVCDVKIGSKSDSRRWYVKNANHSVRADLKTSFIVLFVKVTTARIGFDVDIMTEKGSLYTTYWNIKHIKAFVGVDVEKRCNNGTNG